MPKQTINFGASSDGSQGDTARAAFTKINSNFDEVYGGLDTKASAASPAFSGNPTFTGGTWTHNPSTAVNASMELGYTGGAATTPFIDFHSGATAVDYDYRMIASGGTGAAKGGTLNLLGAQLNIDNTLITTVAEMRASNIHGYRQIFGNYGTFWRQDGGSLFLMVTNSGDQTGSYNSLRPLAVSLTTGAVSIGHQLAVNGAATFAAPLRPAQYALATLPSAAAWTGYEIDVTDASGGAKRCRSDGSAWKILNTTTTVS